ncbi:hypothetical protein V3C99_018787, partial [Haemonchus contortus]
YTRLSPYDSTLHTQHMEASSDFCDAAPFLEDEEWYRDAIPNDPTVMTHIREIAVKGRTSTPWLSVKMKIPARIEYCVKIVENYQRRCLGVRVDLSEDSEGRVLLDSISEKVLSFTDVPFTWRRFCELLYDPLRNYSDVSKYIRALSRVIDVQMTEKECQANLRLQPQPIQSFTPVQIFFDECNLKISDRKRVYKSVEDAKKRLKLAVEEEKENRLLKANGHK